MSAAARAPTKIALIGCGAIGSVVAEALLNSTHGLRADRAQLVAVLVHTPRAALPPPSEYVLTHDAEVFFATPFDVCVEVAGQSAVRAHAERVLRSGRPFLCTSIGALTDDALLTTLTDAALAGGTQLQLASGAMAALDWMGSSAGDEAAAAAQRVTATQTKPPESWIGARFEAGTTNSLPDVIDFAALTVRTVFFEGSARDAASAYPKNSNVLAMLALTTAGLDATTVQLVADPVDRSMRSEVKYTGSAGEIAVRVAGKKSKNPRTSQVVPLSVIKALRNLTSPIAFGL